MGSILEPTDTIASDAKQASQRIKMLVKMAIYGWQWARIINLSNARWCHFN
jgi:hypothetical protein